MTKENQKNFQQRMLEELKLIVMHMEAGSADVESMDVNYYPTLTDVRLHIRIFMEGWQRG